MTKESHGEKKETRTAKEGRHYKEESLSSEEEQMSEVTSCDEGSDNELSDPRSEESDQTDTESGTDVEETFKRDAELLKRKRKSIQKTAAIKRAKKEEAKPTKVKPSTSKPSTSKPSTSKSARVKVSAIEVEKKKPTEPEAVVVKPEDGQKEGEEKEYDSSQIEKEDDNGKKSKKKEVPIFNDKNVDYNLFNDAPENVMARKIKISNTVMVTCKMIDAISGGANGLSYDYAALTFVRKIQNAKAFEFNLPLTLVPSIIEALKLIVKDNPKFFKKHHHSSME